MFASFMMNAWEAGTITAVVAGAVGFFVVLRGSAFAAHAIPNSAFAGAAAAVLVGANVIVGLGAFSLLGAATIAWLGRRARRDLATALAIVLMLGLGAFFLSLTREYESELYSLLFGQILGVSGDELVSIGLIGLLCLVALALMYRPLLFSSALPDVAQARGISGGLMELLFLLVVAVATTTAVLVVGALLIFSLLISPAAAAAAFVRQPWMAMGLSVVIALLTVWLAIVLAYTTNLPIGFFVGSLGALTYASGRLWTTRPWRARRLEMLEPRPDLTDIVR